MLFSVQFAIMRCLIFVTNDEISKRYQRLPRRFFPVAQRNKPLAALGAAFPHTIPILTGYLFLGMSYGVLMKVSGFSFWYPLLISL